MSASKKPEDLGFKITDKKFINKNGTLKKKWIEYEIENDLKIRYSYRIFFNEYSKGNNKDHQLYIGFMRGPDTICSITSHIPGDTGILDTTYAYILNTPYAYNLFLFKKNKFLEKLENEPKILEWCLWNII